MHAWADSQNLGCVCVCGECELDTMDDGVGGGMDKDDERTCTTMGLYEEESICWAMHLIRIILVVCVCCEMDTTV